MGHTELPAEHLDVSITNGTTYPDNVLDLFVEYLSEPKSAMTNIDTDTGVVKESA